MKEGIRAYHKLPVVNFLYLYKTKKVNERKGSIHYTGWRIDRPLPYCRQIGSYFFSSSSGKFSLFIAFPLKELKEKEKVPSTSRGIEEGTERDSETGARRTEGSKDLMIAAGSRSAGR